VPRPQRQKTASRRAGATLKDAERRRLRASHEPPPAPRAARGATLFADGGARPNPGPAAYAFVVEDALGRRLGEGCGPLGRRTVAAAELIAIARGLRRCAELGIDEVEVRSDARAVVGHLIGERPFRSRELLDLAREVDAAGRAVGRVRVRWVSRRANGAANALVESVLLASGDAPDGR
jgi:ribonuclease HI